jgi:hypothetical protein
MKRKSVSRRLKKKENMSTTGKPRYQRPEIMPTRRQRKSIFKMLEKNKQR